MSIQYCRVGRMTYDVGVMGNGALAGLVAITAGCSTVYPWGAIAIGAVAGCNYVLGSTVSILLKVRLGTCAFLSSAPHTWHGTSKSIYFSTASRTLPLVTEGTCLEMFQSLMYHHLQLDDPLDAIAVHAWNGTWGVLAVGFFAGRGLITASYGTDPYTGNEREYGCFLGGNGRLLGAQIIYALWLGGEPSPPT